MDNNTQPKEIYVSFYHKTFTQDERFAKAYYDRPHYKYLSEESVKEMLAEKDINIEHSVGYQKQLLELNDKLRIELAEKDKEIERLKECVQFVIDEPLYEAIHEIQHIRGLYAAKRFTNAEFSLARLCESLDDLMRIEPKKQ